MTRDPGHSITTRYDREIATYPLRLQRDAHPLPLSLSGKRFDAPDSESRFRTPPSISRHRSAELLRWITIIMPPSCGHHGAARPRLNSPSAASDCYPSTYGNINAFWALSTKFTHIGSKKAAIDSFLRIASFLQQRRFSSSAHIVPYP